LCFRENTAQDGVIDFWGRADLCEDGCNRAYIRSILKRQPASGTPATELPQWTRDLEGWALDAEAIYTDGSWKELGSLTDMMKGTQRSVTAAAVVKRTFAGIYEGIKIRCEGVHDSAFSAEVVGQALAMYLCDEADSSAMIHSDCQAALDVQAKFGEGKIGYHYCQQIFGFNWRSRANLVKVKAHPENLKKQRDWSPDDWGIFLADAVTSDSAPQSMKVIVISDRSIERAMRMSMDVVVERYGSIMVSKEKGLLTGVRSRDYAMTRVKRALKNAYQN
jgi:hypothetical protein